MLRRWLLAMNCALNVPRLPDPPRLLLAIPSLLAISVILYTILALAPGDPLGELATNPNVPPAVQTRVARQARPR